MARILFFTPYPAGRAPSQRFRFEQYLSLLAAHGHQYRLAPFWSVATWNILYQPGHTAAKILGLLSGFGRRLGLLLAVPAYDFVFIHREAAPVGPPIFEWLIAKGLSKRIVYDFDDAIWMQDPAGEQGLLGRLKWPQKVGAICRWAYKVSCGNAYLADYARQFNAHTMVNPTTLDTDLLHNRVRDQAPAGPPVIGWTGTHTTLRHLDLVWPVLERLEREGQAFVFHVISNAPPAHMGLRSLRYSPWRKQSEIADLLQFNFGLMPLVDDPWARGKCAFKALQYMALGMPALVSPVGMNTEVVQDGTNGFVCATDEEWYQSLRRLLASPPERVRQGAAARRTIVEHYSVASNTANFLSLFQ
ncbi:glycosyltransferase family 4 protein [Hymenobacter sp. PAMC 26628]|uniref:glycosyltransferase family 4 protein n=1 Tax=Hymenobacter sp. PAMC 26628 TaxID=1484118 RepID=UPI0007703FA5|nr:glycosyltransferase family 4 protein [Hymenobacter sp. PAMC 26628]AMJ64777.1 group 1 glycosyl transferase [Hymenobacter sp. PAMC 26628]